MNTMNIPHHIYEQARIVAGFALSRIASPDVEDWLNAACDAADYVVGHHGYTGSAAHEASKMLADATIRKWESSGFYPGNGAGASYTRNASSAVGGELP